MTMRTTPLDDFLWRATLGAGILGAAAGPLGSLVLWRRMAYLGESIGHIGLLGAGAGLLLGIDPLIGVTLLAILSALIMARARDGLIPVGTSIGVVGHVGLALGFVLLSSMETVRTDLIGYLFGDVLALSGIDVGEIAAICTVIAVLSAVFWRRWLMAAVNADIAKAEGRASPLAETVFLVLVAVLVALGLRVVGALLIVALIIIPPAAARPFARSPEQMAALAGLIGAASAPLGLALAYWKDIPAGPAIVLAAAALFGLSSLSARLAR
ncbi:MAG: metal ABC transporter permease [Alphaproteobacteria bacterium]|nr:metal ABC transporter permease [Alphaproteobacteria bacterium]